MLFGGDCEVEADAEILCMALKGSSCLGTLWARQSFTGEMRTVQSEVLRKSTG
jgi:hypothetical protein